MNDDSVEKKAPEVEVEQVEAPAIESFSAAEAPPEPQQPNALLVIREIDEKGKIDTSIMVLGDVKVTEAETILGLALKNLRVELGL